MSQAVRELQPYGATQSKTASASPVIRSGVTVLEPAFTPRPYNMAPTVKVASQPVPQLTTSRVPSAQPPKQAQAQAQAQANTKIASNTAPQSATQGEPTMTQLNQAKLASGIGVLDTLAARQINPAAYIKQASASNHAALQASADDAYYALTVAEQAPDLFNRAYEMVMWGVKQASLSSKAMDVAGDAPNAMLRAGGERVDVLPIGQTRAAIDSFLDDLARNSVRPDVPGRAAGEAFSASGVPDGVSPQRGGGGGGGTSAERWARQNPYAAGGAALAGTAALGGGGYAAYEGLRDRPWYEQLANAAGM